MTETTRRIVIGGGLCLTAAAFLETPALAGREGQASPDMIELAVPEQREPIRLGQEPTRVRLVLKPDLADLAAVSGMSAVLDSMGVGWRVFLSCQGLTAAKPTGSPFHLYFASGPEIPPAEWGPHHIGTLSFFNAIGREFFTSDRLPVDFSADVTESVRRSNAGTFDAWVGIVPGGPIAASSEPRIHSISLIARR